MKAVNKVMQLAFCFQFISKCLIQTNYRIVKKFGGKKVWRIWQIAANSPKFFLLIFTMKHVIIQFVLWNLRIS